MSNISMKQDSHPAHNLPKPTEEWNGDYSDDFVANPDTPSPGTFSKNKDSLTRDNNETYPYQNKKDI